MKTLYELALAAVPNPGYMADTFLLPHLPVAKDLKERQFREDRTRWQKEHKLKFRYVTFDLITIKQMFGSLRLRHVQSYEHLLKTVDELLAAISF